MAPDSGVRPWWPGLSVDHIYETCPGRIRSLPELVAAGWDSPSDMCALDPEGAHVCGWCLRVWRARNRAGAGAPPEEVAT